MADTNKHRPNLDVFPHIDLLPSEADGLVLPLQNQTIFEQLHEVSHHANSMLSMAHLVLHANLRDTIQDKRQVDALLVGCEIYEILSGALRPFVLNNTSLDEVKIDANELFYDDSSNDTLLERASTAVMALRSKNPLLSQVVAEVAERRLAIYGTGITEYAVAGAGLLRGLQIRSDEKRAA